MWLKEVFCVSAAVFSVCRPIILLINLHCSALWVCKQPRLRRIYKFTVMSHTHNISAALCTVIDTTRLCTHDRQIAHWNTDEWSLCCCKSVAKQNTSILLYFWNISISLRSGTIFLAERRLQNSVDFQRMIEGNKYWRIKSFKTY